MILYKRIGGKGQPGKEMEYTYEVTTPEDLKSAGLVVIRDSVVRMFKKNSLVRKGDLLVAIDNLDFVMDILSSVLPTSAQARIEAAIRYFEQLGLDDYGTADLCRYFLGQEQDTWTDKDFGLEGEE